MLIVACLVQKQETVDQYRRHLERHRFHITQLETVMRLVDNDALSIPQVTTATTTTTTTAATTATTIFRHPYIVTGGLMFLLCLIFIFISLKPDQNQNWGKRRYLPGMN